MLSTIIRRVVRAYFTTVLAAVAMALCLNFEILGATLLLSLLTLPSIAGYVIYAAFKPSRLWLRHLWFALPVLVMILYCIVLMVENGEGVGREIGQIMLIGFVIEIAPAYLVLLMSDRARPTPPPSVSQTSGMAIPPSRELPSSANS